MEKENPERKNHRKLNNKMGKGSNKMLKALLGVLVVVCLFAGGVYIDTFYGNGMFKSLFANGSKTEKTQPKNEAAIGSMAMDIGSKATMAVFGEEFLLCTKDGVKYFASMGDQKWNDTFSMTSPVMVQEGEYIAVGDMGGKTVRVYNRAGKVYDLQTEGSPVQFALNESGYLSLITKVENAYRIRIYNAKGTLLKERVEESSGIYPLCSDVSDNSKVFAVSYLDTTDISPIGRVVLFYIGAEESEEHTDSMFAAVEKTDELLPVIHYMDGGTLAVVSDANLYGIDASGNEIWKYELNNTIDQADFRMKDYVVLALGDSVAGKEGRKKGTVCWIDHNGKEKASYESDGSVTYLLSAEKGVVIGNDRDYKGLTHDGNESWSYTATSDLSELIPMQKLNRMMIVNKEEIAIYDMTKMHNSVGKAEEAEAEVQEEAAEKADAKQTESKESKDTTQNKDTTDTTKEAETSDTKDTKKTEDSVEDQTAE